MKRIARIVALLTLSVMVVAPLTAHAVKKQPQIKSEVIMKAGNKVSLFHSGTADVKKEVCLKDVIPVYRETMAGGHTTVKEVGKVKVVKYVSDHYFEGEVVSGEVKVGDMAKKESAACLIQPAR